MGSTLLTASTPKRSVAVSHSCHSALSSEASQVGGQFVGGGTELLVGHRAQGIEDEPPKLRE